VESRDLILNLGALLALLQVSQTFNEQSILSIIRNATWTLSNLWKRTSTSFEAVKPATPLLARPLNYHWPLNYRSDGPNDRRIQAELNSFVTPRLVELLGSTTAVLTLL
jgi:importin subunit alpha-1